MGLESEDAKTEKKIFRQNCEIFPFMSFQGLISLSVFRSRQRSLKFKHAKESVLDNAFVFITGWLSLGIRRSENCLQKKAETIRKNISFIIYYEQLIFRNEAFVLFVSF